MQNDFYYYKKSKHRWEGGDVTGAVAEHQLSQPANYLSIYLYIYSTIYLSTLLSVYLPISLSICLSD